MKLSKVILLSFLLSLFFGCSKDDDLDTVISINDLTGTWIAISNLHTNNANAAETFEFIANGGNVRYTMHEDGRIRTWASFGSFQDEWDALVSISDNLLTAVPAESSRGIKSFTIEIKDDETVIWTNKNDSFDLSLQGATPVSTTSVTVFKRNN